MTTSKQSTANRANAKLSTGPQSIEGKKAVSGNRITHGILSTKLLLDDENADEYQSLLDDLQVQLRPVGTLELVLVERIAVSFWRQRRLVKAETATIILKTTPEAIAKSVGAGMDRSPYSVDALKPEDLEPPDPETVEWSKAVVAECVKAIGLSLGQIEKKAPLLHEHILESAEEENMAANEYLESEGGLPEYISFISGWCEGQLSKTEQFEQIRKLTSIARDKLSIPWGMLDTFNKYQIALDNQVYKAMKALKEAQDWRLNTIDPFEAENSREAAQMALNTHINR